MTCTPIPFSKMKPLSTNNSAQTKLRLFNLDRTAVIQMISFLILFFLEDWFLMYGEGIEFGYQEAGTLS